MRNTYTTFQNMKIQAIAERRSVPYLYEHFNIFPFNSSQLQFQNNILTRLQNAAIEGFNRHDRLPRFIIIIIDRDILDSLGMYNFGARKIISRWMNWLENFIRKTILARLDQLMLKRPGAVASHPTKLIWVKMIKRPKIPSDNPQFQVLSLRNKMNLVIEEIVRDKRDNNYVNIISLDPNRHFDREGNINQYGMLQFWRELDYNIKMFEPGKATLNAEDDPQPLLSRTGGAVFHRIHSRKSPNRRHQH